MRYIFILIFFISIYSFCSCSKSSQITETKDDEHFSFELYDGLTNNNVSDISNLLNNNYSRIVSDLKIENMPKVTIKIWKDYDNFLNAMYNDIGVKYNGATGYVYGLTEVRIFYNNQAAISCVHEFAHLVSRQVNSSIANNPRWLWEAVALYEANQFVNPNTLPYMVSGNYPTLSQLNSDFNSGNQYIYSVGYVLLEYIIQTWGKDSVIKLIKNNGNVTTSFNLTSAEFELGWYQFVKEKYLK